MEARAGTTEDKYDENKATEEQRNHFYKFKKRVLSSGSKAHTTWPSALRKHNEQQLLGQSYLGQFYRFKRKCPVCAAVYPISFLKQAKHSKGAPRIRKTSGKPMRTKLEASGAVAVPEALVFVATLRDLGLLNALRSDLGLP